MKNIKNTVAAMTLAAVLGLGAVSANAGIIVSDRSVNTNNVPTNCSTTETGVFNQLTGIIIVGFSSLMGTMLSDRQTPCVQNPADGTARDGILIVG